jgi:hypothetical protein
MDALVAINLGVGEKCALEHRKCVTALTPRKQSAVITVAVAPVCHLHFGSTFNHPEPVT